MNDRELLELAAKAAGLELEWEGPSAPYCWRNLDRHEMVRVGWNPLIQDGDALRLAVKLGLVIHCPDEEDTSVVVKDYAKVRVLEDCDDAPDFYAATRRAIVRAAAEIGKRSAIKARNEALVTSLQEAKLKEGK